MDKRYQVFVSSTFVDLEEERNEVIQTLLELDAIPSGMELFPAANDTQWELIKKVINDCDYYIVIIAGRYGQIGKGGLSYTEMEYRYALEQGKPILGFIHKNPQSLPQSHCEKDPEGIKKLSDFCELVKKKHCKMWDSASDLANKVGVGYVKLTKSMPGIGWVRGDRLLQEGSAQEIISLNKKIDLLTQELNKTKVNAPDGTINLSQGDDIFTAICHFKYADKEVMYPVAKDLTAYEIEVSTTWNAIFEHVAPHLSTGVMFDSFKKLIRQYFSDIARDHFFNNPGYKNKKISQIINLKDPSTVNKILIQFKALGLIDNVNIEGDSSKGISDIWKLTPYGDNYLVKRLAQRR